MQADIVWEHLLSGGVTRFAAIYLGNDLDHVGPVRSSRLVDFDLVRIYRALFAYSGMAQGTLDILRGDRVALSRAVTGGCPALCRFPKAGIAYEHTLYGDTRRPARSGGSAWARHHARTDLRHGVRRRRANRRHSAQRDSGRLPPDRDHVGLRRCQRALAALAGWRAAHGRHHAASRSARRTCWCWKPITSSSRSSAEDYWGPGDYAFSVPLIDSGRVFLLRDGQYVEGEWHRAKRSDPLTYTDLAGNTLDFKPGNTFVELVPRWTNGFQLTFLLDQPISRDDHGARRARICGQVPPRATPRLARRPPDIPVTAVGRNGKGDWVQLLLPDGSTVWASTTVLSLDGDVMTLPWSRSSFEG